MNTLVKLPFYVKASLTLTGLYVLIKMLYIAQDIIIPILYATIIAILISPAVNFLVNKRINRAVSVAGVLIIALLIIAALIALLSSQANLLSEAWPRLANKFQELLNKTISWISAYFNVTSQKINAWIVHAKSEFINISSVGIGNTLTSVGGIVATALLTPVYIFMLLFYQPHLIKFIHAVFGVGNNNKVGEILFETKTIIKSYLLGLFLEFVIIAVLNSTGLLILGIDYAILLGIVGALLNVIPYLGGVIALTLFIIITLVTKPPVYSIYVVVLYTIIQLIDNNYIVPKVVGSKVKLNALISIVAVIAGGALWGIPGMFLSIPATAVIKLILERIESLKAWGFLLGDTMPPIIKWPPLPQIKR